MRITREIEGRTREFELSSEEMYEAYLEQEFKFDRSDIVDQFEGLTDEELVETYGASRETIESLIDEMAREKRRNIDKYDMSWQAARDEAIQDAILKSLEVAE